VFSLPPNRDRFFAGTAWSLAAHIALGAGLFYALHQRPVHVFTLPGSDLGTRVELTYLPGRAPAAVVSPQPVKPKLVTAKAAKPTPSLLPALPIAAANLPPMPHLTVTEAAPSPNSTSPAAAIPDASSGSDSWGSGSMQIALTTFSPSPKPDLSTLPHGVQGDVIVDVTIDPNGKVTDLAVLHTIGYGIDSSVIGTLKTWIFHPATRDGAPISSVQELHFHFGPV
jgi:protein TonB